MCVCVCVCNLSLKDVIFLYCIYIFSSLTKFTARLVMSQIRRLILISAKLARPILSIRVLSDHFVKCND